MRISSIPFPKLPILHGRLGAIALIVAGSISLTNESGFAQGVRQSPSQHSVSEGTSSREAREQAVQRIPFKQLTPQANQRLRTVVDSSSYFRRMPTEQLDCDPEMFAFLVRNPEVIVNIWDVMGVTKVALNRTGPYQLSGQDGAGTSSQMDLVYGTDSMHIYFASGSYKGSLWARELTGRCVVVLQNKPVRLPDGKQGLSASMDVFMKLDNMGADLIVKTLGPLVGKTADFNFTECAAFVSQISQTAEKNPYGIQQLAKRLTNIDPKIQAQFVDTAQTISQKHGTIASRTDKSALDKSLKSPPLDKNISKDEVVAKNQSVELVPILTMKPNALPPLELGSNTVSPSERSSRRTRDGSVIDTEDERVDSPTILLLGDDK
jgi:hypothetical protein